jgi:hypothetical protein
VSTIFLWHWICIVVTLDMVWLSICFDTVTLLRGIYFSLCRSCQNTVFVAWTPVTWACILIFWNYWNGIKWAILNSIKFEMQMQSKISIQWVNIPSLNVKIQFSNQHISSIQKHPSDKKQAGKFTSKIFNCVGCFHWDLCWATDPKKKCFTSTIRLIQSLICTFLRIGRRWEEQETPSGLSSSAIC